MTAFLKTVKRAVENELRKSRFASQATGAFLADWRRFRWNAGALHLDRREAALAEIVMGYHVLEKGLTMPRRRTGFGRPAALHLAQLVDAFEKKHGPDPQASHAAAVLRSYRQLHAGEDIPALDAFLAARPAVPAAAEPHVRREDFFAAKDAPFPAFAASRHCVRHFAGPVPRETVERAIALAATAPSACNRQPARVHVVDSPALRDRILALQGGTRGFGSDADKLLVVAADLSAVRWAWERHDAFTNGGIFALNLCYALHHEGVAHCLLHWSVPPKADRAVRKLLDLPAPEEIVLLVACGLPPDEFDFPASPRRDPASITTWHGDEP